MKDELIVEAMNKAVAEAGEYHTAHGRYMSGGVAHCIVGVMWENLGLGINNQSPAARTLAADAGASERAIVALVIAQNLNDAGVRWGLVRKGFLRVMAEYGTETWDATTDYAGCSCCNFGGSAKDILREITDEHYGIKTTPTPTRTPAQLEEMAKAMAAAAEKMREATADAIDSFAKAFVEPNSQKVTINLAGVSFPEYVPSGAMLSPTLVNPTFAYGRKKKHALAA